MYTLLATPCIHWQQQLYHMWINPMIINIISSAAPISKVNQFKFYIYIYICECVDYKLRTYSMICLAHPRQVKCSWLWSIVKLGDNLLFNCYRVMVNFRWKINFLFVRFKTSLLYSENNKLNFLSKKNTSYICTITSKRLVNLKLS